MQLETKFRCQRCKLREKVQEEARHGRDEGKRSGVDAPPWSMRQVVRTSATIVDGPPFVVVELEESKPWHRAPTSPAVLAVEIALGKRRRREVSVGIFGGQVVESLVVTLLRRGLGGRHDVRDEDVGVRQQLVLGDWNVLGTRRPIEGHGLVRTNESEAQGVARRKEDVAMRREDGQVENHAWPLLVRHVRAIDGSQKAKSLVEWRKLLSLVGEIPELRSANGDGASEIAGGPSDREASVVSETFGLIERVARNGESGLKMSFFAETRRYDARPPVSAEVSSRLGIGGCCENAAD